MATASVTPLISLHNHTNKIVEYQNEINTSIKILPSLQVKLEKILSNYYSNIEQQQYNILKSSKQLQNQYNILINKVIEFQNKCNNNNNPINMSKSSPNNHKKIKLISTKNIKNQNNTLSVDNDDKINNTGSSFRGRGYRGYGRGYRGFGRGYRGYRGIGRGYRGNSRGFRGISRGFRGNSRGVRGWSTVPCDQNIDFNQQYNDNNMNDINGWSDIEQQNDDDPSLTNKVKNNNNQRKSWICNQCGSLNNIANTLDFCCKSCYQQSYKPSIDDKDDKKQLQTTNRNIQRVTRQIDQNNDPEFKISCYNPLSVIIQKSSSFFQYQNQINSYFAEQKLNAYDNAFTSLLKSGNFISNIKYYVDPNNSELDTFLLILLQQIQQNIKDNKSSTKIVTFNNQIQQPNDDNQQLVDNMNGMNTDIFIPNTCSNDVSQCCYLVELKQQMNNCDYNAIDNHRIELILNNFLHLIQKHNNWHDELDDEFEIIYNELGGYCDIKTCELFKRNNRNRLKSRNKNELYQLYNIKLPGQYLNDKQIIYKQIIDKIHCFYRHCYDVGNALSEQQKNELILLKKITNNQPIYDDKQGIIINKTIMKQNKMIKNKYQTRRGYQRFAQINHYMLQNINQIDDNKNGMDKMYSFGYRFAYEGNYGIMVTKKYNLFKEELVINEICTISINQFDHELTKAKINFNSPYCKHYIKQHKEKCNKQKAEETLRSLSDRKGHSNVLSGINSLPSHLFTADNTKQLKVHHILALMIYCNFDTLQFEFSKTYRNIKPSETKSSVLQRHSNFYFLGKYLKEVVDWFGIEEEHSNIKRFYHGVTDELLFSKTYNVEIYCPLSSSSSINVAANFSHDSGLVIEFTSYANYFSVEWLSDYGNEQEHLFIQQGHWFSFKNIIHVPTGAELKQILQCIVIIDKVNDATQHIARLIKLLIHNELHHKEPSKYKKFQSLHKYAKELFHQFCINKKSISIYKSDLMNNGSKIFIHEFFCVSTWPKWDWINLDLIHMLFPNIEEVSYGNDVCLCEETINNILTHIISQPKSKLKEIIISLDCLGAHLGDIVVEKFKQKFQQQQFNIEYIQYKITSKIKITKD